MANQALTEARPSDGESLSERPIRATESDISHRLAEAMGEEGVTAFSRRCGIGESTLRGYLSGAEPSVRRLQAIADTAGVTLQWLATGAPPKRRADLVDALRAAEQGAPAGESPVIDLALLRTAIQAVEEGLLDADVEMPPDKKAEVFVYAYELIGQMGATEQARQLLARLVKLAR